MTKLVNRTKMTTATTGTGAITLESAVDGYQAFVSAGVVDGDNVRYVIEDGPDWEIGNGVYTSATNSLSRNLIESSTGALLNLTGGAVLFVSASADQLQHAVNMNQGVSTTDNVTFKNITPTGTVAGRNIATDGNKLDGIEAGATADQTPAEIKTAYESNTNTNAFTDAEKSKLAGIEAGADVTNTINVTAAGALMDSEVANLAAVKSFDPADYATAAQGSLANSAIQPGDSPSFGSITVTGTVDGRDVAADGTKLDGIEIGATADQTPNEILTAIKTVDGPLSGLNADLLDGQHASSFATAAQGTLADTAAQPGDNISQFTNDAGYQTGNQVITLSGDVTGSGSTSISVTIKDDSHNHVISNIDGLQAALDDKYPASNPNGYTSNIGDITGVTAGSGLTGGGTSGSVTLSHADTSTQTSVNNSGATVIQDVTLDGYGHVTGLASATITPALIGAATSAQGALATSAVQPNDSPTFATVNATTVDLGDWTVTESAGTLFFAYQGTNKMKLDSNGNLVVTGDVTAFGSV